MKRVFLCSLGLILGTSQYGCQPAAPPSTASGGATGSSGGAQGNSGGAQGNSGGAQGNSGGAQGNTGGAQGNTGGAQGNTGGAQGNSGGAQGNTGGAQGNTGGAGGGNSTGTGGRVNTGGAAGGSTVTGSGGAGATGGSSGGLPDVPTLFPTGMNGLGSLDGRLVLMPCVEDNASGTDCKPGGFYTTAGSTTATKFDCQGSSFTLDQVFPVGGDAGKTYTVTIHVYGIAEPKIYDGTGVTRDAGTGRPGTQDTGSNPTPWATAPGGHTFSASDYNSYEIRSCKTRTCAAADETAAYYLNADTQQGHWTFVMNYEKQIKVTGGGAVRVRNYDRNCREIKNCGMNGTPNDQCATVANARKVSITGAMPAPSMSAAAMGGLLQPNLTTDRGAGNSGQWVLIDVVKVDSVM